MRQILFPVLLVVVGCAGGSAPSDGTPTTSPGAAPGSADWSDPLVGDGEIAGGGGSNSADKSSTSSAVPSAGAAESGSSSGSSGSSGATSSSGGASGSATSGGGISTGAPGAGSTGTGGSSGPSHTSGSILTAGTWDDNKNFSFFSAYRTKTLQAANDGWLNITDAETLGASTAFGGATAARTSLDISLVIDTTGSMGDEISYLQREFSSLAQTIEAKYPQAQQHWSLVLYKDKVDEYVVKWFDFRADRTEFQQKLLTASAGGGGDFPESPEQAIGIANRLSWRRDANVARLMFWVADAPHHNEDTATMTASIKAARDKNIHIYPVASSGVDEFTEYTMRSTAQLTGGRYIFLTDDSGVGGAHEEPTVPCYFVTKLDKAILRMVDVEFTGTYREPEASEILRTSGDPQSGICKASGTTVSIY